MITLLSWEGIRSVTKANIQQLKILDLFNPIHGKYNKDSQMQTRNKQAKIEDRIVWMKVNVDSFDIPLLSQHGLTLCKYPELPELIDNAMKSSSMKGKPVSISSLNLEEILVTAS